MFVEVLMGGEADEPLARYTNDLKEMAGLEGMQKAEQLHGTSFYGFCDLLATPCANRSQKP